MASEIMLYGLNKKPRKSRRRRKAGSRRRRKNRGNIANFGGKRRKRRFGRRSRRGRALSLGGTSIMGMLKTGAAVGSGGVLLDVIYSYLPIPANLKTGPVSWLTKGAVALGVSVAARKFLPRNVANQVALGAVAVVLYGAIRSAVNTAVPSLQLGLYDDLGLYSTGAYNAVEGLGYMGAGVGGPGMLTGPETAVPNEANFNW